jgi:hydroxypyruvate reductase
LNGVDARRVTRRALDALADSLAAGQRIRAVVVGKAASGMAHAIDDALGDRLVAGVITGTPPGDRRSRWQAFHASHPKPTAASEAAGRGALALADATRADGGVLLVCLSGGASAMMAVPAPGLTIEDKAATTAALLAAGLDIGHLNVVRRHMSAVKGGQLAARAGRSITLAISDVCTPVEDDPMVIGSGPTAGDRSTFADALAVVRDAGIAGSIPPAVLRHLEAGASGLVDGPVPPDDARLRGAAYWVVGSRREAMAAAADAARHLGYHVEVRRDPVIGEARLAGPAVIRDAAASQRKACVISSGETTVVVRGRGRGGRNQELAVSAIAALARQAPAALASIGTDGLDGPTDAAGAMVDADTLAALGPSATARIDRALADNDAYPLLESVGALVRTGPTGTNVGDLQIVLLG